MSLLFKRHPEKKQQFAHILAGLIIMVHAYEKFDLHQASYVFFLIGGIVFLTIAILHHRLTFLNKASKSGSHVLPRS